LLFGYRRMTALMKMIELRRYLRDAMIVFYAFGFSDLCVHLKIGLLVDANRF